VLAEQEHARGRVHLRDGESEREIHARRHVALGMLQARTLEHRPRVTEPALHALQRRSVIAIHLVGGAGVRSKPHADILTRAAAPQVAAELRWPAWVTRSGTSGPRRSPSAT